MVPPPEASPAGIQEPQCPLGRVQVRLSPLAKACACPDFPSLPVQDGELRDQGGKGARPQVQEVLRPQPRAGDLVHAADGRC